jgi:hypothetical protein
MEPAAPVAGETVRFSIDISTARGCCVVHLDFGDGSEPTSRGGNCTAGLAGTTIVATHTYAAPGAYTGRLIVASIPCQSVPVLPGEPPASPGMIYGPVIATCVAVGPGTPAKAGC